MLRIESVLLLARSLACFFKRFGKLVAKHSFDLFETSTARMISETQHRLTERVTNVLPLVSGYKK